MRAAHAPRPCHAAPCLVREPSSHTAGSIPGPYRPRRLTSWCSLRARCRTLRGRRHVWGRTQAHRTSMHRRPGKRAGYVAVPSCPTPPRRVPASRACARVSLSPCSTRAACDHDIRKAPVAYLHQTHASRSPASGPVRRVPLRCGRTDARTKRPRDEAHFRAMPSPPTHTPTEPELHPRTTQAGGPDPRRAHS